ncbi:saccharopine dehydrogenase NADP-binding domain-containing protein [Streptomyces polygonati]|uniref:Saccharopine dehydrogenase NADP-binding domain-containing protein n=1 Tax=Streptomyces polygonati TaxID=1617087 RepID=A0ABV8HRP0_9ACTN
MSRHPVIGVLGASGAVGRAAVRELRALGHTALRLGGRRPEALHEVAASEAGRGGGDASVAEVDADDPASLARFAAGCAVVLNCAGPTYRLRATVPAAALAAGAHCVDVAGDDPAAEDLAAAGSAPPGLSVVLSAGTLPGLSGILPRWLARQGHSRATALTAYCGGLEPCTPTVAADLLLSLSTGGADGAAYGEPLAAWRAGRKEPRALRVAEGAQVPGFPGRVAVQPFLGAETERLAYHLGLDRLDWFNVHPGPRVRSTLNEMPGRIAEGADREELAETLMLAARLDLAGHTPYYVMDFHLTGSHLGRRTGRRLTVRTSSSYRLTAAVGTMAVTAVLRGEITPGVHYATDVLDPDAVVDRIRTGGSVEGFDLTEDGAESTDMAEEGTL